MKTQRLVNAGITASGATASAICLTSIAICAGLTVAWFASAPFVPDRVEQQIHRPILPAAGGVVGSLVWLGATAAIAHRWHKDEDDEVLPASRL